MRDPFRLLLSPDGEYEWRSEALCAQTDPDLFFPEVGQPGEPAKRVCRACNVQAECLDDALANDERFGVWGAMSPRERARLKASEADSA